MTVLLTAIVVASIVRTVTGVPEIWPPFAVLTVSTPASLTGKYAGRFANATALPTPHLSGLSTSRSNNDAHGCSAFANLSAEVVIVLSGGCDLEQKASYAKEAGAKGLLIVSEKEHADMPEFRDPTMVDPSLDLFVIGIKSSLGKDLFALDKPVQLSVEVYQPPFILFNVPQLILVCFATALTAVGAFFSTSDLRLGSPLALKDQRQVLDLPWWAPLLWVVGGSIALVVLYFTMQYLIYVVLFAFWAVGVSTVADIIHQSLRYYAPGTQKKGCALPIIGDVEVALIMGGLVGLSLSTTWLVLRKTEISWVFQDIIAVCFLSVLQRGIRLRSIKLATIFLLAMFAFDIFWTFLSPLFFTGSVMVVTATGGGTGEVVPMLLRIPAFGDPVARDSMLGYGDVALPGLLISFLRRFDMKSRKHGCSGYFVPSVIGYGCGLLGAMVALYEMQIGQPALLYLVPGTLGVTMLLALTRGDVKALWEGKPVAVDGLMSSQDCNYCHSGHSLQVADAPQGTCDGCGRRVEAGEKVSDCRMCNWYLCATCRPQKQSSSASSGGTDVEQAAGT